ncbi:WASH complex subunit 3-like [Clavelina lepadiformis]|uniref:WASH complex subunit 3-like n=1 Tax=Clavelina lepadiformis TaxID=159417 RepID=UPI0040417EC2
MMEDATDEIGLSGPAVDLNKVPSLNHRRSVTFMNQFFMNTANFLNNFSAVSEEQLAKQSAEIQKLEISLNILEAKLASIPGLDKIAPSTDNTTPASKQEDEVSQSEPSTSDASLPVEVTSPPEETAPVKNVITVRQDPRYAKYLKMVMVGVPKAAIENKMRNDGLDSSLLDTPDAPVPDAVPPQDSDESDNESQSLSSGDDDFSD